LQSSGTEERGRRNSDLKGSLSLLGRGKFFFDEEGLTALDANFRAPGVRYQGPTDADGMPRQAASLRVSDPNVAIP
jgi:hypothetical protein